MENGIALYEGPARQQGGGGEGGFEGALARTSLNHKRSAIG